MSVLQADADAIQFKTMNLLFRGESLGPLKKESMEFGIEGIYAKVDDVDGFEGVFKVFSKATLPTFKVTVKTSSIQFMVKKFLEGQVESNLKGAYFGTKDRDLAQIAGEIHLHPKGTPEDERDEDIKIWNAVIEINIQLLFGGELPPEYEVVFIVLPDLCREAGKEHGFAGDWSFVETAPNAVIIGCDRIARNPLFSETTLAVLPGQSVRRTAFNVFYDLTTVTFDVNNVAGYAVNAATITFDNLNVAGALVIDRYIETDVGGAIHQLFITAVNYTAGNVAGTIDVIWNTISHNATAVIDDQEMRLITNIDIERARDKNSWASSVDANVKAGDDFTNANFKELKGQISHVLAGASNITSTNTAVSSPALVVTAL